MSNVIKTEKEIKAISKAMEIGDLCFTHILGFIKVGMTEIVVAKEIEKFLFAHGSVGLAFDTICVSGVRTALPHGEPTDKCIEDGDFVTMDFGAVIDGYCGDMTRTIAMGHVTEKQRQIYEVVLKAQMASCEKIKGGISCFDVDKVARDIITEAGYGEFFIHGLGHGVGELVHEAPTLNARSTEILAENMVVTIEPGIYIPNEFGVRIEDLAIVTSFGIINKSKSPKELICC